jgi:hypothetical protein
MLKLHLKILDKNFNLTKYGLLLLLILLILYSICQLIIILQNIINVTINSSKTYQYGKKETLQISKNIENICPTYFHNQKWKGPRSLHQ